MQILQEKKKKHLYFISTKRSTKSKKVGEVLKKLGLDKIGTKKGKTSINHDSLLYK